MVWNKRQIWTVEISCPGQPEWHPKSISSNKKEALAYAKSLRERDKKVEPGLRLRYRVVKYVPER